MQKKWIMKWQLEDEVDIPPETNEMTEDGAEIAENVISDADAMAKEITE